ncbi:MAG: hypothetical protein ABI051_11260 [Vicinamibacterales bacterium]
MTTVFYISGHGFGHASREVEVINALGQAGDCDIVVRSSVNPDLLRRTLRVPVELLPGACDTGIIQTSSIANDRDATVGAALEFYGDFAAHVDAEIEILAERDVQLVVGDVPPLAFAVAGRLQVPSVALANFTWDWIYEEQPGFLPAGATALELMRTCYRSATLALALPYAGGFEVFPRVESIPMIARHATQPREATRTHFGIPLERRMALLSFGGYGLPALDLPAIDVGPEWTIVTTDRVSRGDAGLAAHVHVLAEQLFADSAFRYEDLVAAADVVVTKPGYGIITECVSTGTAMLYTSRGDFREYATLVAALPEVVRSQFIEQDDLLAGRWRDALEALLAQPAPPPPPPLDGASVAAGILRQFLSRQRC